VRGNGNDPDWYSPGNAMSSPQKLSRRDLLLGACGFTLAFTILRGNRAAAMGSAAPQPGDAAAAVADGAPTFAPNAFIRIDRTGPIRLVMPKAEMGQGIHTGDATLLAEELEVGLDQVLLEDAPPNEPLYWDSLLLGQITGGSTSTRATWQVLREAGAVARTMLVEAAARMWSVDPSNCTVERGVVNHAATGRSAPYGTLASAAAHLPVPTKVVMKDPIHFKLIGKPFRRLDTTAKIDGSAIFGLDVRVPNMKIAVAMQCPSYGGRLRYLNDTAARAVPGVCDVVRLDNVVAVIGDHFWAAKAGADCLKIEWDAGPHSDVSTTALFKGLEFSSRQGKAIVARETGDLGQGGRRHEAIYQLPMLAHAPMEPLNAVVHVRPDACEIWVGTQVPVRCVKVAAKITNLSQDKIVLHNTYLGGAFGARLETDSVELAVRIARPLGYPVKMVWTREEDIQHDVPRPPYYDRIAAILGGDGLPKAWTDRITGPSIAARWAPEYLRQDGLDKDTTECAAEPPYDLPNLKVEWVRHDMPNGMPVGWWRGVGPNHNIFKVESFIDELAYAAGRDPVAYRRLLLQKNNRVLGVLELAAQKMRWDSSVRAPRIGRGVAVGSGFGSHLCSMLEVEVSPQGEIRLRRSVTAVDCGMVINPNTVEAQIQGGLVYGWTAALYSKLTYVRGAVTERNFNDYRVMRMNETPPLEVHIVESREAPGGIGEAGTAIAAPALLNALFAATGVRIRSLPIDRTLLVQHGVADKMVSEEKS
jgi:isoquinoline 1-oxidoreductase beta subunit